MVNPWPSRDSAELGSEVGRSGLVDILTGRWSAVRKREVYSGNIPVSGTARFGRTGREVGSGSCLWLVLTAMQLANCVEEVSSSDIPVSFACRWPGREVGSGSCL